LAANPHVSDSDKNVRLLRASITAIRCGSPDDAHMAIRYARFLETLLNASLHSSRAESPARNNPGGGGGAAASNHHAALASAAVAAAADAAWGGSGADWDSSLTLTSTVDSLASLHFPIGPGNHPGDLFQWWDNFFND
jgi:hypothetical protein